MIWALRRPGRDPEKETQKMPSQHNQFHQERPGGCIDTLALARQVRKISFSAGTGTPVITPENALVFSIEQERKSLLVPSLGGGIERVCPPKSDMATGRRAGVPFPGVHACSAPSSHPIPLFLILTLVACTFSLRYHAKTIQLTLPEHAVQWVFMHSGLCIHHHDSFQDKFMF